jgi:hypothetical protein
VKEDWNDPADITNAPGLGDGFLVQLLAKRHVRRTTDVA